MRNREYISPSAISLWKTDTEQFYSKYLCEYRLENEPQTRPMSIGSAFDAYTKSYLYEKLFGVGHNAQFGFDAIFEQQVEPHNRDWARVHGRRCFENYTDSGALNDLFLELDKASSSPRFEFEVKGGVKSKEVETGGMVLLGKPDCYYMNKEGHPVILDWKVNGWLANSAKSPEPGYVRLRHCDGTKPKSLHHKDAVLVNKNGVIVNSKHRLEDVNADWAGQLSVYGWLCGEEPGSEFLTCIDQIVCKPTGGFPEVRIAEHRTWVSKEYQLQYLKLASEMWEIIHSDHIFRDMTLVDSIKRCEMLDAYAKNLSEREKTDQDDIIKEMTRTQTW